ncbi:PREDICTED: uncharacterized protein LOC104798775 [Tarenaya hassleriana]|uniref:uncharacterized protein LOC104798775 n=1 Tax=Tarenaya hassleriana TaxID=28532 RepID=UPI00053C440E|nr:PREDICTED: uncharacterized protein LOC104798775 [Tarenaya hassleriana]
MEKSSSECELPSPPLDVKLLCSKVSFMGWKLASNKYKTWVAKMAASHKGIWEKAGIFEAIMASTYRIWKNEDLIFAVAERWCPDTKAFVFPFGEATVTVEDVKMLLGFSVSGSPVFSSLESSEMRETKEKIEREMLKIKRDGGLVNQVSWMLRFMDRNHQLEHEAFLVLWLNNFVFPCPNRIFSRNVIPIAVHLARGTKIALAPAVLESLYQDLDSLKQHIQCLSNSDCAHYFSALTLRSLFSLVQVWAWERFSKLGLKPKMSRDGEPRLARWHNLKQSSKNFKQILASSGTDSFEWYPYGDKASAKELPLSSVYQKETVNDGLAFLRVFPKAKRSKQSEHVNESVSRRTKHGEENFSLETLQEVASLGYNNEEPSEIRKTSEESDEVASGGKEIMPRNPSDESKMQGNVEDGIEGTECWLHGDGLETRETLKSSEENDKLASKGKNTMSENPSDESNMQGNVENGTQETDQCLLHGDGLETRETLKSNEKFNDGVEREDNSGDGRVVSKQVNTDQRFEQKKHSVAIPGLELEMRVLELKKILAEIKEWQTRKRSKEGGVSARF